MMNFFLANKGSFHRIKSDLFFFWRMFEAYKKYLLDKARYEKDENGVIIASIPWYDAYFSQGDSFEEARGNLLEVIEELLIFRLEQGDRNVLEELKSFTLQSPSYA